MLQSCVLQDSRNTNNNMEVHICELFTEFIKPCNVLHSFQKILTKQDYQIVEAKKENDGDIKGANCLLHILAGTPNWFPVLLDILCDPNVKLQHIARLMQEEERNLKRGQNLRSSRSAASLYIHYNNKLKGDIQDLFLHIDIDNVIPVFPKYSDKVLTKIDIENVKAKMRECGNTEGKHLLLERLVLYEDWYNVLLKVLGDPYVKQGHLADKMEKKSLATRKSYEDQQKAEIFLHPNCDEEIYQRNQEMLTDSKDGHIQEVSSNRPWLTASFSEEFQSDSPEMKSGVKCSFQNADPMSQNVRPCLASAVTSRERIVSSRKTDLMKAAEKGDFELLKSLITEGLDIDGTTDHGLTAVMYAARGGHSSCIELLISNGCNVNKMDEKGNTSLIVSANKGHSKCVEALICSGADVNLANKCGTTALMLAAKEGHYDCMRLLLEQKCNPDFPHPDGRTPLMYAVFHKHLNCVKLLIDYNCDLNVLDSFKTTALMFAANKGYYECIQLLIDGGADINQCGMEGNSPLMLAVVYKHMDCVELLIKKGANLHTKNEYGYCPLDAAREVGFSECVSLIKRALQDLEVVRKE